jgi:hypothetical protein
VADTAVIRVVPEQVTPGTFAWVTPTTDGRGRHGTVDGAYRKRGIALYAAIAASLAAVIAVAALVFVVATRGDRGGSGGQVTVDRPPPAGVRLVDEGSAITVSWVDPVAGRASFVVSMGHPGEVMKAVGEVAPGRTSYRMSGLNARLDYCFTVAAVYGANTFGVSSPSCTKRTVRR